MGLPITLPNHCGILDLMDLQSNPVQPHFNFHELISILKAPLELHCLWPGCYWPANPQRNQREMRLQSLWNIYQADFEFSSLAVTLIFIPLLLPIYQGNVLETRLIWREQDVISQIIC